MLAEKWVQPTRFTGRYPDGFNGWTFLDWDVNNGAFHPGDDYNFGSGSDDLNQDVGALSNGVVVHTSLSDKGYGNIVVIKYSLGYNLRRFVKERYGIDTDVLYSLYAHLSEVLVAVGNEVAAGALVAKLGKTGTTSPHLHCELYAPIPGTGWRFWPTLVSGWTKEKIKEYYLSPYLFVEAVNQGEGISSFLGKSKEYWLQIEKDLAYATELLKGKDEEKQKIIEKCNDTVKQYEIDNQQLSQTIAKMGEDREKLVVSQEKEVERLGKVISDREGEIEKLRNRVTDILAEGAEAYALLDAVKILVTVISKQVIKILKGGEKHA